MQNYEGKRLK